MSNIDSKDALTPHQEEIKAERILISQTLDLTPLEISIFLASYGIPRSEYDYLCSKYSRLIDAHNKEKPSDTD